MIRMKRVLKHRHENMILVDPRLKGVSSSKEGEITTVNKGVFTSCKINNNCPAWSIKADKIVQNKGSSTNATGTNKSNKNEASSLFDEADDSDGDGGGGLFD